MLQEHFEQLLKGYTNDSFQIEQLWTEIATCYSKKNRHYHTLVHLEYLYQQLLPCENLIKDWHTVLFALYYHDIIYNPLRQDNEEQSATLAAKRLKALSYPLHKINNCHLHILATKGHQMSEDIDTNFFTDADLSILGSDWPTYTNYYKNVRKEYAIYPDFLYTKGRAKVLQQFLQMERLYKTDYFYERLEEQARRNMLAELEQLS